MPIPEDSPRSNHRSVLRRPATLLLSAAVVLSTAACTGDGGADVTREDFRAGACRQSAAAVLDIQGAVGQLEEDSSATGAAADTLKQRQSELRAKREQADAMLQDRISELTNAVGVLRIGIDAQTVNQAQLEGVSAALDRVITVCTTG